MKMGRSPAATVAAGLRSDGIKDKTMKIRTENYEDTHGKKPRGEGIWAFNFHRDHAFTTEFTPCSMKFSDAKRWAKQTAKQIGGIEWIDVGT